MQHAKADDHVVLPGTLNHVAVGAAEKALAVALVVSELALKDAAVAVF